MPPSVGSSPAEGATLTPLVEPCNTCTMTTTTSISYQDARNLLIATSVNHGERGIGTPSTDRRNYSLTEALACLANSRNYRTQDTNGIVTLTSTGAFGDYVWYLDTEPRRDPWA